MGTRIKVNFLIKDTPLAKITNRNFFRLTRLQGAVLVYGAGTLIAQVLILRELLVLAQGQELKLALGLWGWLLWTGLGALLGGRWGRAAFSPPPQPSPLKGEGEKAAPPRGRTPRSAPTRFCYPSRVAGQ